MYFVDDLNKIELSEGASLTMYADDVSYSQPVLGKDAFKDIQCDIDKIAQWVEVQKAFFQ